MLLRGRRKCACAIMRLLADIGNSRVQWTLANGDHLEPAAYATHDECARAWHHLQPDSAHYCSVASADVTAAVLAALPRLEWLRLEAVERAGGVINGYACPAELGDDRWAALLGARVRYPEQNVVIVDAGTAVTVDALAASGQHVGGAIIAGYRAQRAGLSEMAPALPRTGGHISVPARNTLDALATGGYLGLAGAIERVARALGAELGEWKGLLTGGDARSLSLLLDAEWIHEPMLTLRGLQRLE